MPRREPEHVDLAAIETDLEFLMERLSKLPTRQELALRPLYIIGESSFPGEHCLSEADPIRLEPTADDPHSGTSIGTVRC
jgi:hypothetical protein